MRRLTTLCLLLLPLLAFSADQRIELIITVTNPPVTGDNISFSAPSKVITWSNVTSSSYVLTNSASFNGSATNLFLQIAQYGIGTPALTLDWRDTNKFALIGGVNQALAATNTVGWATLQLETNPVTRMIDVRIPISGEKFSTNRVYISSKLVEGQSDYSTNSFSSNATAMIHFLSLGTNAQTALGSKLFWAFSGTNSTTIYGGTNNGTRILNATYIGGVLGSITNGYGTNTVLDSPKTTNLVNYGNAISSPGTGSNSEQFGTGAVATNSSALAVGNSAIAGGDGAVAVGNGAFATNSQSIAIGPSADASGYTSLAIGSEASATLTNAIAIGTAAAAAYHNSIAIGVSSASTAANQIRLGSTTVAHISTPGRIEAGSVTNMILTGTNANLGDWSDTEITGTGLANGDNTPAYSEGYYVRWAASGPTAAFAISGFTGIPRSGQQIKRWNDTGQIITINHESGTTGTTNRIITGTGANVVCGTNTFLTFRYSSARSRWVIESINPAP
jgi:hypothetical protein